MGRSKLNFTSLFFFKPNNNGGGGGDTTPSSSSSSSSSSTSSSASSWAWPSCKQAPRTDSFRSGPVPTANMFKTLNSIYLDSTDADADAFSSSSDIDDTLLDSSEETIVRGLLRSADRLLFEPDGHTSSSILPTKTNNKGIILQLQSCEEEEEEEEDDDDVEVEEPPSFGQESVAMAMAVESWDPYGDFRRSMEEMVTAQGMMRPGGSCSWDCLEELLVWYLKLNAKKNHGFIVAAFVDLLLNQSLAAADSDDRSCTENGNGNGMVVASSSDSTMSSSSVVTCLEIEEEEEERTGSC